MTDRPRLIPMGTRTLLLGAHQFLIHPVCVAIAWTRLYGVPLDPRLWIAFLIHDWGYWGKQNLDGDEGETHPEWAAGVMERWFGKAWGDFCLYHSRHYASRDGVAPSPLCAADKLALSVLPAWAYLPLVWLTGEIREYRERTAVKERRLSKNSRAADAPTARLWYAAAQDEMREWAYEYRRQHPAPVCAVRDAWARMWGRESPTRL